jgi:hypothetical protein
MKKEFLPEDLEMLTHISKVEAPPFLFTRIREKVLQNQALNYSPKISRTLGWSLALVLIINMVVIFKYRQINSGKKDLLVNLNLQANNNLYP